MTATWKITALHVTKTNGSLSNVVTDIDFTVEDSETIGSGESAVVHAGYYYGNIPLGEPDSGNFIEYSSITENDAIGWVKSLIGSEKITEYEGMVANQISESKNPPTFMGVPW